ASLLRSFFFVSDTASPQLSPLSLHDALPISPRVAHRPPGRPRRGSRPRLRRRGVGAHLGTEGLVFHGRGRRGGRCRASSISTRRSEEHTSELQSLTNLVCRLLLEKKNTNICN